MKNQFLSDNYIRQKLRKYRIKYGHDPSIIELHPDDVNDFQDIYGRSSGMYDSNHLYDIQIRFNVDMTRDTITLI